MELEMMSGWKVTSNKKDYSLRVGGPNNLNNLCGSYGINHVN